MTESPDYMKNRHNIVQDNKGNIQRLYNNIQRTSSAQPLWTASLSEKNWEHFLWNLQKDGDPHSYSS